MRNYILALAICLSLSVTKASYAETQLIALATECAQQAVDAGASGNNQAMLAALEAAKDYTNDANEDSPSPALKKASLKLSEATDHLISGKTKEALLDARSALTDLRSFK